MIGGEEEEEEEEEESKRAEGDVSRSREVVKFDLFRVCVGWTAVKVR
jgi:hypothetical protein